MSDRTLLKERELERGRIQLINSRYAAAVILLAAVAGFLLLVFELDRVFDFERFAY